MLTDTDIATLGIEQRILTKHRLFVCSSKIKEQKLRNYLFFTCWRRKKFTSWMTLVVYERVQKVKYQQIPRIRKFLEYWFRILPKNELKITSILTQDSTIKQNRDNHVLGFISFKFFKYWYL